MKYRMLGAMLLLFLVACQSRSTKETTLQPGTLDSLKNRLPEKEILALPLGTVRRVSIIDGIICLYYNREQSSYALALWDMDLRLLRTFVEYGPGADQMMLIGPTSGGGRYVLPDPILKKVMMVDIKKAAADTSYHPVIYQSDIYTQEEIPFGERILFLNPYAYKGRAPRVLVSDKKWNYRWRRQPDYSGFNINIGRLIYSPEKERIAYCPLCEPVIELMDGRGNLIQTITFPRQRNIIGEIPVGTHVELVYQDPIRYCFLSADGSDDLIACVFEDDGGDHLVVVFDWEGNIIDGFRTGFKIKQISLASDSRSVYCWESDGERERLDQYLLSERQ